MGNFVDRRSFSDENKGRGELNVYLVYAILVAVAALFLIVLAFDLFLPL